MEDEKQTIVNGERSEEKGAEKKEPEATTYMTAEKYEEEKNLALKTYYQWLSVPERASAANDMLQKFESLTRSLSASLCEQLRILLEPTQRTKLKGDYKTGTLICWMSVYRQKTEYEEDNTVPGEQL